MACIRCTAPAVSQSALSLDRRLRGSSSSAERPVVSRLAGSPLRPKSASLAASAQPSGRGVAEPQAAGRRQLRGRARAAGAGPPRTEADRDRIEALSLFASGRAHEQREEDAKALRCYERALRFDPQSSAIVRAILPVAIRLGRRDARNAEAVRYAEKLTDFEESDIPFLLELRDYLMTGRGLVDGDRALREGRRFAQANRSRPPATPCCGWNWPGSTA